MQPKNIKQNASLGMVARMLGAAFLAGGYIFRYMGAIPVMILLIFTIITRKLLHGYLIDALYYTNSSTQKQLVEKIFSKRFAIFTDFIIILLSFGTLTSYQVVSSKAIQTIIEKLLQQSVQLKVELKFIIRPLQALILIFPFTLLKNTKQLKIVTPFSVICVLIITVSVFAYFINSFFNNQSICLYHSKNNNVQLKNDYLLIPTRSLLQQFIEFFKYFPTLTFMLSTLAIPIDYDSIHCNQQVKRQIFKQSVNMAVLITSILYCILSFSSSFGFGQYVTDNVLNTFKSCQFIYMDVMALLYAFVLNIAFSLILQPPRLAIMNLLKKSPERNYGIFVLIGIIFILVSCIFACFCEKIVAIFGLFSAMCGYVLYFLIPIMCYFKLPYLKKTSNVEQNLQQIVINNQDNLIVGLVCLLEIPQFTQKVRSSQIKLEQKKVEKQKVKQIRLQEQQVDTLLQDGFYNELISKKYKKYDFTNEYQIKHMKARKLLSIILCMLSFTVCAIAFVFNLSDFIKK